MTIEAIGTVRHRIEDATDHGWGEVVSEIHLRPELASGLQGLETFSHVVVVFLMHAAKFDPESHLVRRPRDQPDMSPVGIFAQRARHRPNPIGVTTVEIESVRAPVLVVRGLDAIDGSPVLDIKPHVPLFDAPESSTQPEWVSRLMAGYFKREGLG